MSNIHAPFNFVPLNKDVYIPSWWNQVSIDKPFTDGEDGVIKVTLNNVSPLFVRDAGKSKEENSEYSAHIGEGENKKYFIPGTTLKGMLRAVLENMSFAKMDKVNEAYFGYRNFDDNNYKNQVCNKNVSCGWLIKKEEKFELKPCIGNYETISHEEIEIQFPTFKYAKNGKVNQKQNAVKRGEELYPIISGPKKLVCTGPMNGKKIEYLFPVETYEAEDLDKDVVTRFLDVHKSSPQYDIFDTFYKKRLEESKEIPVFFTTTPEGEVEAIGLTRMMRYPYKHKVSDGVKQNKAEGHDLPSVMFGFTNKENSLKGRIQIGSAWSNDPIKELGLKSGVLGQPRASYFPLYLQQDKEKRKYTTYDNNEITIAGRKRYRIHKNGSTEALMNNENNDKVGTKFRPLPSGQTFVFEIRVHNLRPIEIGAILSALTFHGTKNCWHNVGLAKAFGYGKVKCMVESLKGLEHSCEDYLRLFEEEMSNFTYKHYQKPWNETEQIRSLISIASEHEGEDVTFMSLKDYSFFRKDKNFSVQTEQERDVNKYISDLGDVLAKRKIVDHFADAEQLLTQEKFNEAQNELNELKRDLYLLDEAQKTALQNLQGKATRMYKQQKVRRFTDMLTPIGALLEEAKLEEAKACLEDTKKAIRNENFFDNLLDKVILDTQVKIENCKKQEEAKKEEEEKKEREKKNKRGLVFLEETDNKGELKVQDWKGAENRIKQWMKKSGNATLPTDQLPLLEKWLVAVFPLQKDKEKKNWLEGKNGMWRTIADWTNEGTAERFKNNLG